MAGSGSQANYLGTVSAHGPLTATLVAAIIGLHSDVVPFMGLQPDGMDRAGPHTLQIPEPGEVAGREGANFFTHHKGGRSAPVKSLTTEALELFASSRMCVDEVSSSTVNRDLTAIQSFVRWLREKHPHALPVPPRFDKHAEPDYSADAMHLERDEYARLRTKLEPRWHSLFDLLIQTGLRIGEAQGLRCEDLTPQQVFVHRDVKTPSRKRRVPLNDSLSKMLQAYIRDRPKEEHVFSPYLRSRDNAYHAFVVASLAAGLCEGDPPKATHSPHSLRHTFGVTAARAGLTLLEIRDLLGHSDIGVTQRYAQYAPDSDRSKHQAAAIGKLLAIDTLNTPPVPQTPFLKSGRKVSRRRMSASTE